MVVFGQTVLFCAKVVVFLKCGCVWAKWLRLGKNGFIRESCCIWAKVVVFGQKWLYSDNAIELGRIGCFRAK